MSFSMKLCSLGAHSPQPTVQERVHPKFLPSGTVPLVDCFLFLRKWKGNCPKPQRIEWFSFSIPLVSAGCRLWKSRPVVSVRSYSCNNVCDFSWHGALTASQCTLFQSQSKGMSPRNREGIKLFVLFIHSCNFFWQGECRIEQADHKRDTDFHKTF